MDQLHERVARLALRVADSYGFCLAGGYAVQAHGFVSRLSEDVDLFTTVAAEREFPDAVQAVVTALTTDGLTVSITVQNPTFARIAITDPTSGITTKIELGIDWRAHPPTYLDIGPVLHPDDAVANKVGALYGRGEVRDYIDVDGILRSGRYQLGDLLRLAADHDPGFEPALFAEALTAVRRLPATAFAPYAMTTDDVAALQQRIIAWAAEIRPTSM